MTQLLPFIQQNCHAPIWRMEIDDRSQTLFVEVRNEQEKSVSFSAVNLESGDVYFNNLTTPERWLTGIESAFDGVLLLHNYQSESGPVHKAITAIDAITGQTLWSNYTMAFDQLTVNGPIVYSTQIQPKKLMLTDVKTGVLKRPYNPTADAPVDNHITSPQLLPADFLQDINLPVTPYANMVHYMKHNNGRIVSLHALFDGQLQQHLYIFNNDGAIIYHDLLNSAIQKLQPEAFVVHRNRLIYIKDKSELIVLNL